MRPSRLCHAVRVHDCAVCTYYKKKNVHKIYAVTYATQHTVIYTNAAREAAQNNGCNPWPKMSGDPYVRP
jgi:hypothetical protein